MESGHSLDKRIRRTIGLIIKQLDLMRARGIIETQFQRISVGFDYEARVRSSHIHPWQNIRACFVLLDHVANTLIRNGHCSVIEDKSATAVVASQSVV